MIFFYPEPQSFSLFSSDGFNLRAILSFFALPFLSHLFVFMNYSVFFPSLPRLTGAGGAEQKQTREREKKKGGRNEFQRLGRDDGGGERRGAKWNVSICNAKKGKAQKSREREVRWIIPPELERSVRQSAKKKLAEGGSVLDVDAKFRTEVLMARESLHRSSILKTQAKIMKIF